LGAQTGWFKVKGEATEKNPSLIVGVHYSLNCEYRPGPWYNYEESITSAQTKIQPRQLIY